MEPKGAEPTRRAMESMPNGVPVPRHKMSTFASPLRAACRIRHKYLLMKRRRVSTEQREPGDGERPGVKGQECQGRGVRNRGKPPEHFTFDKIPPVRATRKRRSHKKRRVLYPNDSRKYLPEEKKSKAKHCLFLLSVIVFFQIYNAIENLDDNVLKYDLAGLEKTLKREVFGQAVAIDRVMDLLNDYLSTHSHNKPLVLSVNGPIGVGKSLLGRLLAKHFRSVLGDELVYQYYVLHHCPTDDNVTSCQQELQVVISEIVSRAEDEEKIPMLIFDEVELMQPALLDFLHNFLQPNQTNEFLNAVYILVSNHGQAEITKFVLHNASSGMTQQPAKSEELLFTVRSSLVHIHPLWNHADIVPFTLLQRHHILECFLEKMMAEGFYPDSAHLDKLAGELNYYSVGEHQFSVHGCKHVDSKMNLLH